MERITDGIAIPAWLRPALSLILSASAALLYGILLSVAIIRTVVEGQPTFSPGTLRAAELLSALVGSVVTAGFARGKKPLEAIHASWFRPRPWAARAAAAGKRTLSLAQNKLVALGEVLGLYRTPFAETHDVGHPEEIVSPEPSQGNPAAFYVGMLYFGVYLVVGAAAFVVTVARSAVPDLVANSAWVWMGTLISSAYAFFALGQQE